MLHSGGADYKPTGPGPGDGQIDKRRGGFKFRRKPNRSLNDLMLLYILEFLIIILPVVDGSSTTQSPSANTTNSASLTTSSSDTTPVVNASPFNKVAGSVLVCLGVPIVSFLGLKLFVYFFPECCHKSDFKRLGQNSKDCCINICCPRQKTNVVTPTTITKSIELFTTHKIVRDGDIEENIDQAMGGTNLLKMLVTLNKTKTQFHEFLEVRGGGNRRYSNSSVDTLDGTIINTTPHDAESGHIFVDDKYRSASRSPTPPPDIVIIYPKDNVTATPSPKHSDFRPIRNTDDLDGKDVNEMPPLEQNMSHSNTSTPVPHSPEGKNPERTMQDATGKCPSAFNQMVTQADVIAVDSPRSELSGQSVPKQPTKILARSNTRESMCVIRIELPERTEPDGMEAPIQERSERDDSSFLTVETDYRGESDGGEDSHDIGEVDSYYTCVKSNSDLQQKLGIDQQSLKLNDALSEPVIKHSDKVSLVRRGSYGCEANKSQNTQVTVANAATDTTENTLPCSTTSSPGSSVDPGSGSEADDDDDGSYYSISCPSSNVTPYASQLNTPNKTPEKKLKHARNAKRLQELKARDFVANGKNPELSVPPVTQTEDVNMPQELEQGLKKHANHASEQETCTDLQEPNMYDRHNTQIQNTSNHVEVNANQIQGSLKDDEDQHITVSELPSKIACSPITQDNLAVNNPESLEKNPVKIPQVSQEILSNKQGEITDTVKPRVSVREPKEQIIKQYDGKNQVKSHTSRLKKTSNLSTGVYTPSTRRVLQKPRTHISKPSVEKSESDLSKSSTSSSQSSIESPFTNITPSKHSGFPTMSTEDRGKLSNKENQVSALSKKFIYPEKIVHLKERLLLKK